MNWEIKVVALEDQAALATMMFIGKEMTFNQLSHFLGELKQASDHERHEVIIRYELYQMNEFYQKKLIGIFTWILSENTSLYDSLKNKTAVFVKTGKMEKKLQKKMLTSIEKTIISDRPLKLDKNVYFLKSRMKKRKEKSKDKEKQSIIFSERLKLTFFVFYKHRKKLVFFFFSSLLIGGIVLIGLYRMNPSFETLARRGSYSQMFEEYPNEFWEWQRDRVREIDKETLDLAYKEILDPSIAFDLAFLRQNYIEAIHIYSQNTLIMDEMRYSFLGMSYLRTGEIEKAEAIMHYIDSIYFFEYLIHSYLREGKLEEAERVNRNLDSIEMRQLISDYRIIIITMEELSHQINRDDLSEDLINELMQSKESLKNELVHLLN